MSDQTPNQSNELPCFESREHAGRLLGERLRAMELHRPLVLAVPRGGLPVAQAIARAIDADLDIAPGPETELPEATEFSGLTADRKHETDGFDPRARDVVIVEDGVTTGAAVLAAARRMRRLGADRIVIATPIVCGSAVERLLGETGFELVAIHVSKAYDSLGEFFAELGPIKDKDVDDVRQAARDRHTSSRGAIVREITIKDERSADSSFVARLTLPGDALAVILALGFSSLASWLRRELVDRLASAGYGVIFCEKVESECARSARQLLEWISKEPATNRLPIGLLSFGGASVCAIEAAASVPELVRCMICMDAEPDVASASSALIGRVMAATLFIAGEADASAVAAGRKAVSEMTCESSLVLVPGSLRAIVSQAGFSELVRTSVTWLDRILAPGQPLRGAGLEAPLGQRPIF